MLRTSQDMLRGGTTKRPREGGKGTHGPIPQLPYDSAEVDRLMSMHASGPVTLPGSHEASPPFDQDWTNIPGSSSDPKKKLEELELRDARNKWIREMLNQGRAVRYSSSGCSMWPMIQPDDACTFHPAHAVSGREGVHAIQKDESEIHVGDVFCQVQPGLDYYAHIVLEIHVPKKKKRRAQRTVLLDSEHQRT